MTSEIFDKMHLRFVKKRMLAMTFGESNRGGYRPLYAEAADTVLEKIYGGRRIATKILESRSYQDVASVLNKIDYEAFFQMLRGEASYRMLAGMIMLRYRIDRGDVDSKNKKYLNKAIARIVDDFDIRTDSAELMFDDLISYAKGHRNGKGFDSIDLFDDDEYRPRKRKGKKHDYGNLFDDDDLYDDDYGVRAVNDYDYGYDEDLTNPSQDAFDAFVESENRRNESRRSRNNRRRDDRDDDLYDDKEDDKSVKSELSDAINSLAEVYTKVEMAKLQAQTAQPQTPVNIPMPEPKPKKEASNQEVIDLVGKLATHIDARMNDVNGSISRLAKATEKTFDDVYDRLAGNEEDDNVVDDSSSSEGNFVCSSKDFLDAEISKSVSKNSEG